MKKKENLFAQYPLAIFFVLSYLLSWWSVPIMDGALFPYGPMLAAVLVLAAGAGRPGLREWWARMTHWRAGWWYLIGPAILAAALLGAYLLSRLFGAEAASPLGLPAAAIWIQLLLFGGLWEEPGWTGYALPELQNKFRRSKNGPLLAALSMAVLRAVWHLPLLASGTLPWFDVFGYIIAFQLIIAWLYNRTGGSVPAVMVFHYFSNLLVGGMMLLVFAGSEKMTYWMLFAALAGLAALLIYLIEGAALGTNARKIDQPNRPGLPGEP